MPLIAHAGIFAFFAYQQHERMPSSVFCCIAPDGCAHFETHKCRRLDSVLWLCRMPPFSLESTWSVEYGEIHTVAYCSGRNHRYSGTRFVFLGHLSRGL